MAINATTVWRVRVGGDDNNGGAFDADIVGAGTDYSDQDTAQLTLTDLTTSGASAVVNSATGGFTAAMIGNAIRIASGTNFTAGTYFIVAVGSGNSATLDSNCSTASGSGGVGRVGGAHASPLRSVAAGSVAGNTVMICGQGSNNPTDTDYFTSAAFGVPNGTTVIGYNGRPKIGHNGALFSYGRMTLVIKNVSFIQTAGTNLTTGVTGPAPQASYVENCVFDQGGFDSVQTSTVSAFYCSYINTGSQTPGVNPAVRSTGTQNTTVFYGIHVKDVRGPGVYLDNKGVISNSIIQNCGSHGIVLVGAVVGENYNTGVTIHGCTIHGNLGDGININTAMTRVSDNLITGHTTPGTHGIDFTAPPGSFGRNFARVAKNNFFGNSSNSNYSLSALDTTIDPQYVNAPTDLTPTNTALRYLAGIGSL